MRDPRGDDLDAVGVSYPLGLTPAQWRAMVERRQAPKPTGRVLGRPVWSPAILDEWFPADDDGRRRVHPNRRRRRPSTGDPDERPR